ncbi:hypothetical protein [Lentzea sp. NPDC003310]|uniref:hypothetical protein n=1 Tax=Lentzea sp. NPDC003310 TaxID=3154447 RepID=UPI0033A5A5F3
MSAAFAEEDGKQPGDPVRGVRAVLSAMDAPVVPHRLVLGGAAYDAAVAVHEKALVELRVHEKLSRGADY